MTIDYDIIYILYTFIYAIVYVILFTIIYFTKSYINYNRESPHYGLKCEENGKISHRFGKPTYSAGTMIEYKQFGKRHRRDGAALENQHRNHKEYYQHGKYHRLDGPAVEDEGYKVWYYKGQKINCVNQQEFEKYLKLMVFM